MIFWQGGTGYEEKKSLKGAQGFVRKPLALGQKLWEKKKKKP